MPSFDATRYHYAAYTLIQFSYASLLRRIAAFDVTRRFTLLIFFAIILALR